ncbi:hypothetical protein GCM10008986_16930 [Salinibacillus aidingensis]|uniref:XRE family transcriptional regulator n=1 Tax=Salinibacillus aidingensis TaxID=237684 RepID=A0ABP3L4S9_9BACI
MSGKDYIGDVMGIRFNAQKVNELIDQSGFKKMHIATRLNASQATFRRWMNEETPIPFVKVVELKKLLEKEVVVSLDDLYEDDEK